MQKLNKLTDEELVLAFNKSKWVRDDIDGLIQLNIDNGNDYYAMFTQKEKEKYFIEEVRKGVYVNNRVDRDGTVLKLTKEGIKRSEGV